MMSYLETGEQTLVMLMFKSFNNDDIMLPFFQSLYSDTWSRLSRMRIKKN